ncbi:MAG: 2Fe-2S iron-sulfur cluster binding domain-containing protein [Candidatus Dormibacteraeota bacterium]|nr:2Fe-2S iron-sulfur cluster binding domain-containing protein [Candidatus Dormibacteraeota bacterium]
MTTAKTHRVKFDPVGIEIEVSEDETVLEGGFRSGLMLMHGCKEGQCSACKSFLIEGEIDLERYSTFALADYEKEEGYTLLCRAHAYSDLVVELINYDEEMLTSGVPIQIVKTKVEAIEPLTRDIRRLVLRLVEPREMAFNAGQYVDLSLPGSDWSRSFSMANTPDTDDRLEFMIKVYPGGRFSGLLEEGLKAGDPVEAKGPYGTFVLRERSERDLVFLGGGAGMAPIWCLLNSLAEQGSPRRATYYYGARTRSDLFHVEELRALEARLPGFRCVFALSEPSPADAWEGEVGFITDVLDRCEPDLTERDAYLCGPPPMVDAGIELMARKGVPAERVHYDKFTTTASAGEEEAV